MKRKDFLIVFSAVFFIALLAVATAPTRASPTNNWGVDEGTTLTYTIEETRGNHETTGVFEIEITAVEDLDSPGDDLDDIFFTYKVSLKGIDWEVQFGQLSGNDLFDYSDVLNPHIPSISPPLLPVLPIDDDGPGVQGLDWTVAKSDIEALIGYDDITVTEDGDMFKVELVQSGTLTDLGDIEGTQIVEWDKSKGTLESYLYETVFIDAGTTRKTEITKGEPSLNFVTENVDIIALGALGVGVLALLVAIIKK